MKSIARHLLLRLPRNYIGDYLFHLIWFWVAHGRVPRMNSGLLNDYFFFRKVSDELYSPLHQLASDKALVKLFYRAVLGEGWSPKTLLCAASSTELFASQLVGPCVVKPTHLSGAIYAEHGIDSLDRKSRADIERWFKTDMYQNLSRERNYRYLTKSVVCEEVVGDWGECDDFKIFS